jgi:hypothetical protein
VADRWGQALADRLFFARYHLVVPPDTGYIPPSSARTSAKIMTAALLQLVFIGAIPHELISGPKGRAQDRAPGRHTRRDVATGLILGLVIAAAIVFGGLLKYTLLLLPLAFPLAISLPFIGVAVWQRPRSRGQLPPQPGQGGQARAALQGSQASAARQPEQAGHDPAPPRDVPGQARAGLRSGRSRPGWPRSSGGVRTSRGIRPVPGAV